ncbi:MAG: hypothetical protein IPM69_09105 [Ignavibacteria bacterium]|nr:hypothetical protein [Ignavibacteria bacterium]
MKSSFFYSTIVLILCYGATAQSITGVVNVYTPVLEINTTTCRPLIVVQSSNGFSVGDKVLIIQMQGATVDLSNTSEYGKLSNYNTCGNHEFARISGITNNTIFLQKSLLNGYTISGKVQLVRVPEYEDVTIKDSIICPTWDGSVGGIIVLDVKKTLTLNGTISSDGKGFRGGIPINSTDLPSFHVTDFKGPVGNPGFYAHKGEGIGGDLDGELMGKGAPANGGGGGNNHNAGGGGGANGGCGGKGGFGWERVYSGDNQQAQGIGGKELDYIAGKIFLGGGGGAGHTNQNDPSYGGNGGGIVLIRSNHIIGNGYSISANGFSAPDALRDAAGGGGSGGTIILLSNSYENLSTIANGGKGGDNTWTNDQTIAPGGGGGGGILLLRQSTLPNTISTQILEGASGVVLHSNNKFGSSDGCIGKTYFNATIAENITSGQPTTSSTGVLYSPVIEISTDRTKITVGIGADDFCPDNKLLIIQMRGADVQTSPSDTYGKVTSYRDAGNYEFCRISSISGNILTLTKPLERSYTPAGKVQVVRVPEFRNYTLSDTLFCPQWNDTIFGVVALSVSDTLRLKAPIIANGAGFSGGRAVNAKTTADAHLDVFNGNEDSSRYALKGDGIANFLPSEHRAGRGALAIAGGGGNNHNAGGGGGANGGCGGKGGYGWDEMKIGNNLLSQGLGGYAADNTGNKIFMGGGGGAGHSNELTGTNGGNGGGIVIIDARIITSEGSNVIFANGITANNAPYDGAGGGGGGGTIILKTSTIFGSLFLEAQGGYGGKVPIHRDGPGGGGGGGVVWYSQPATPAGATASVSAGYAGTSRSFEEYGQTDGCTGNILMNVEIPGDKTILSVNSPEINLTYQKTVAYPQPAKQLLTIQATDADYSRCALYDMLGNVMSDGEKTDMGNWVFDVSRFSCGVYVANLYSTFNCSSVRVVICP